MTLGELRAKIREWDFQNTTGTPEASSRYESILNQLDYHASKEWRVYLPAEHPDFNADYMERLAAWLGNVSDDADRKLLLEYALYISFFSHDDFAALYRTALNREIVPWVAAQIGATLETGGLDAYQKAIHHQVHNRTWFCPVTDSMDINEFYKVNHLKGVGHRPGFSTLQMLAEKAGTCNPELAKNVVYYMEHPSQSPNDPPLERLVLLEDIVGSGTQCIEAVRWAVKEIGKSVLFVPLILCPKGAEALHEEERAFGGRLTVRPVIALRRNDLLGPERKGQIGWPITTNMEDLVKRCGTLVGCLPFGYENTGCSLVTFSNTPDNTLPIVHCRPQSGSWAPLFPRVYRD